MRVPNLEHMIDLEEYSYLNQTCMSCGEHRNDHYSKGYNSLDLYCSTPPHKGANFVSMLAAVLLPGFFIIDDVEYEENEKY